MDTLFNYQSLEKQNLQSEPLCCDEKYPRYLNNPEARSWYKSEKIWNCAVPRIKRTWFGGLKKLASRAKLKAVKRALRQQNLQYYQ